MDATSGQNRPPQGQPHPASGLIRPEQVSRLPQLNPQQKQHTQVLVTKLWEIINTTPQNDPKYSQAQQKLASTSQTLMLGMKQFRQNQVQGGNQIQGQAAGQAQAQIHAQAQAAAAAAAGAQNQQGQPIPGPNPAQNGVTAPGQGGTMTFNQLLPEVREQVNSQQFYYPPAVQEGTPQAAEWLREAKARYGQALQRGIMARNKKNDFQRQVQARQAANNPLNAQEQEVFQSKITQCNRAISESQSFMEKFREQQTGFMQQRQQQGSQRFSNVGMPAPSENTGTEQPIANTPVSAQPNVNAHSITSAVNAARNIAQMQQGQSAASPPNAQAVTGSATPTTMQNPLNSAQSPIHTASMDHSRPSSAHPGQSVHASALQQQPTVPHAHSLNTINGVKREGPVITKNLQVADPKPVTMPPSRPTLNGGAGVGLPGQIAQPALTALPGYVLESSEDGRVLSKKKLNELVREVCGSNPEDQLTPEAEEIFLTVADDFVDDLISAACKLAKLRGANQLEVRDIQVVLERQYNIRIPGFSTDEVRTVRRSQPAPGWAHKMSAVQAAKLTGGGQSQALGLSGNSGGNNNNKND